MISSTLLSFPAVPISQTCHRCWTQAVQTLAMPGKHRCLQQSLQLPHQFVENQPLLYVHLHPRQRKTPFSQSRLPTFHQPYPPRHSFIYRSILSTGALRVVLRVFRHHHRQCCLTSDIETQTMEKQRRYKSQVHRLCSFRLLQLFVR
jgi:hypothetical protein